MVQDTTEQQFSKSGLRTSIFQKTSVLRLVLDLSFKKVILATERKSQQFLATIQIRGLELRFCGRDKADTFMETLQKLG